MIKFATEQVEAIRIEIELADDELDSLEEHLILPAYVGF